MPSPDTLPQCLTRTPKIDHAMSRNGVTWFYLFCANCGTDGGRVMDDQLGSNFAFYLCEPCAETYGPIVGTYTEPDHEFWSRVLHEQIQKYGRVLSPDEQVEVLKDDHSTLAKLAKDKPDFSKSVTL